MERGYMFGGVGVTLRASADMSEKAELAPFAAPPVDGFTVSCDFSEDLACPDQPPLYTAPYETLWRWEPGMEAGLHRCQRDRQGPPWPYCLWRRRGKEIFMTWRPEYRDTLSAFQILERVDLFHLLLLEGGLVLHGSYIVHNGAGIVFSAPCGTGKSTQAALWEKLRGAEVVNGDRCLLRPTAAGVTVHGICYSGTSHISKNVSAPLKALVLLGQAPENRIRPVRGLEAFRFLLGQCAYRTWDKWDVAGVTEILSRVLSGVPVFRLDCRPDEGAVETLENLL